MLANDADVDGDDLELTAIAINPGHGTVDIDDNGTAEDPSDDFIVYTPEEGYVGPRRPRRGLDLDIGTCLCDMPGGEGHATWRIAQGVQAASSPRRTKRAVLAWEQSRA